MTELNPSSLTQDRRLDRIIQFDERSRNFPISLTEPRPRQSRLWPCQAWLDQGKEGACVAFSLGHELAAEPVPVDASILTKEFLVRDIYWEAQKIDGWEGGAYPGAMPQYDGTSVLCGVKQLYRLGYCQSYRWAFGLEQLIEGVGYEGPAVIGIPWYKDMYDPDANGYVHMTGEVVGGHAILVRGVDVENERFILRNSWGQAWGLDGDCYVSFTDMDQLLKNQGEAVFILGERIVPELPEAGSEINVTGEANV